MKGRAESCCPTELHHKKLARCRRRSTRGRRQARLLPPQADGKEGPGEVAGCGARVEALDLNHAIWQSKRWQLSQNGSSRTTSSCLQVDPVMLFLLGGRRGGSSFDTITHTGGTLLSALCTHQDQHSTLCVRELAIAPARRAKRMNSVNGVNKHDSFCLENTETTSRPRARDDAPDDPPPLMIMWLCPHLRRLRAPLS